MNVKDSGQHLAAHEILDRDVKMLNRSLKANMSSIATSLDRVGDTMGELRDNVQELQTEIAVTTEKLEHVATDKDLSTAIATCQRTHDKPINWKAITALITGVIAAIAAAAIAIIQAL